jgi:hypothetical protein
MCPDLRVACWATTTSAIPAPSSRASCTQAAFVVSAEDEEDEDEDEDDEISTL